MAEGGTRPDPARGEGAGGDALPPGWMPGEPPPSVVAAGGRVTAGGGLGRPGLIVLQVLVGLGLLAFGLFRIYHAVQPDEPQHRYLCPGTTAPFLGPGPGPGASLPATNPPPRLSDEPCR